MELTDWTFLFQGQEAQGSSKRKPLAFKKNYLTLFSFPSMSIKQIIWSCSPKS